MFSFNNFMNYFANSCLCYHKRSETELVCVFQTCRQTKVFVFSGFHVLVLQTSFITLIENLTITVVLIVTYILIVTYFQWLIT